MSGTPPHEPTLECDRRHARLEQRVTNLEVEIRDLRLVLIEKGLAAPSTMTGDAQAEKKGRKGLGP